MSAFSLWEETSWVRTPTRTWIPFWLPATAKSAWFPAVSQKKKKYQDEWWINKLQLELYEFTRRKTRGSPESGLLRGIWESHPAAGGDCRLRFHPLFQKGTPTLFFICKNMLRLLHTGDTYFTVWLWASVIDYVLKRKRLLVLHLVSPAGGVCSGFTPRTEEGGLLRHRDSRDEGDVLRELQSGSGCQYLLRRDGPDHSQCSQNLPGHHQEVSLFSPQFPLSTLLHYFLTLCWFAFLPFRPWDDETLGQAYDILLEELALPPSAPGGKVEFRRSLTLSLLFKFYLEVLHKLKAMVKRDLL